jgi:hypothetical protein
MVRATLLALALSIPAAAPSSAVAQSFPEIDMAPHEPASFGIRNVAAGAHAVLGGWNYWYKERVVEIETVPSDSRLQLFFIRSNFQKRFEEVEAPIRVRLPSRIETGKKDSFALRVAANGYSTKELSIKVNAVPEKLVVSLAPLPNSLTGLSQTHLAGRTTLSLRTIKEPELRIMKGRGSGGGFMLSLSETANQLPEDEPLSGGWLDAVQVSQVGEDLLVRLETTSPEVEVRSKQSFDAVRREHVYVIDLVEKGARPPTSQQIRARLEALPVALDDCSLRFEATLRTELEPETLARGMRASGGIADIYRREAMMRLGRTDQGQVTTLEGEVLRTGSPIELELALQSGATVNGYLTMLGTFARSEPHPELAMRSLVAPELSPATFAPAFERADAASAGCP